MPNERLDSLLPRLQVVVYLVAFIAVSCLLFDQYRLGWYRLVLTNAISLPLLLFGAVFIYINREQRYFYYINYVIVGFFALLILYQLPDYPVTIQQFVYIIPLLSFFALPFYAASIINLFFGVCLVLVVLYVQEPLAAIRLGASYGLLFGSAWSFAYLTRLKSWSLRRLALTDSYSGAYNYRHFLNALDKEIVRSQSMQKNVSLIGLIIDDYAMLLDIHGPEIVAQLLPSFVDNTQQLIRTEDEIFRLNDDLFVLMLPNCDEDNAQMLMERIKQGLQEQNWGPVSEISLTSVALGVYLGEQSTEVEERLLQRLKKQRLTSLQMTAFDY